jgi:starch phosphorylase
MPPIFSSLPRRLAGLADLALNLSWSWNRDARQLFRAIDPSLWARSRSDPVEMLPLVSAERLAQCAANPEFVAAYDAVMRWHAEEKSSDATWFASSYPSLRARTVAYFCAEFGFYHSVPIYSGGLGVLAGDHLKTASDLGVPSVGVGILYRGGYFDQRIRPDGWQEDVDDLFDPSRSPLSVLRGANGEDHLTVVRTFGRDVHVRAWRLEVGRVPVILLDSDLEANHPDDRGLLTKLYAGGPELRLKQEWLLGIGGVRALRALNIDPAAWHANEGHAAFMLIERLRELIVAGASFESAVEQVRGSSTFTTHTPVPAGHDMFPGDEVAACTGPIWEEMGVSRETFMGLGRHPAIDHGTFHMTVAAIRLSRRVNAVSLQHAEVTRRIWLPLWPDRKESEVPIGHVTNGVHLATWMSNSIIALLDEHLGADWGARVDDPDLWERLLHLDDGKLWNVHRRLKRTFLSLVTEEARHAITQRAREVSQLVGSGVLLAPEALTIGFARRFATYKRANLIFHDVDRMLRIITNPARPVQIIFAGKAHPADTPGKQVLQEVYQTTRDARFEGRIAFVEDYDLHIAHVLVQGVDLWLNLPRVPLEASGTSGMKAALNGVPQLSTLDGWWTEGFDTRNGWAVGSGSGADAADDDVKLVSQLYDVLEKEIVPAYYDQDAEGIPRRWIAVMKHAIRAAGLRFTGRRMVMEYVRDYYVPSMMGDGFPDEPPTA